MRARGVPFVERSDGMIQNQLRIKLTNRSSKPQSYLFSASGLDGLIIELAEGDSFTLDPSESGTASLRAVFPRDSYKGKAIDIDVTVSSESGELATKGFKLLGPSGGH